MNTRNRQLRGKQFWNQNKKKSVTRIGSLAAFDTEMGKFKLEEIVSDAETMAPIAQTYFAPLFKPQVLRTDIQDMLVGLLDTVPEEMQISLGRNVTAREVEHVIRLMKKSVAPGPDGIPAELYQAHAKQWGVLLSRVFNAARKQGRLPIEVLRASKAVGQCFSSGSSPMASKIAW